MDASPPPLLVVRGELRKQHPVEKSSEKGARSPTWSQVSVKNIKSSLREVKKSFSNKVFLKISRSIKPTRD